MSLLNELESLVAYFEKHFPDKTVERQNIPTTPNANTIFIRAGRTNGNLDTGASILNSRLWEVVYYGESAMDVMDVIERMKFTVLNDLEIIPLLNSTSVMRVRYFNFSPPFLNENNQSMALGNFRGDTRTARTLPEVGTIQKAKVNRPSGQ